MAKEHLKSNCRKRAVQNVDELTGEEGTDLMSAGMGIRYSINKYLSSRIDYGWQLKELTSGSGKGNRLHASFILSY